MSAFPFMSPAEFNKPIWTRPYDSIRFEIVKIWWAAILIVTGELHGRPKSGNRRLRHGRAALVPSM